MQEISEQAPAAVQAVQVPFATERLEHGEQEVAVPPLDHCPDGHAAHELPLTYCPAEQVTCTHDAPLALYPPLHETAVHPPEAEQAVHLPFVMPMLEQGEQEVAVPPLDHCPDGHAAHELPLTYCPAAQFSRAHTLPFHAYPAEHVAEVHARLFDAHALHVPFDTAIEEQGLQYP
ncbi:MAG TPA: hypothetical protein DD624_01330 [Alphaproteobacteria bacterium]|nr:hypothetical protein [Alphaproteobacteria bacterium]